jgi:2'-5' RNA ligase
MAEKLSIHNANYREKPFHPHITIAFRDLKKAIFNEAWDYYSNRLFQEEFTAESVTLLKHNGQFWTQHIHYQLGTR